MAKATKLSLNELNVQSFVTNENTIIGGKKTNGKNCETNDTCASIHTPCIPKTEIPADCAFEI